MAAPSKAASRASGSMGVPAATALPRMFACASHRSDERTQAFGPMSLMYWPFIQSSFVSSNTASFLVTRSRLNFSHSVSRSMRVVSPSSDQPRSARKFTMASGR